jgi:choline-glycine betaine transporter
MTTNISVLCYNFFSYASIQYLANIDIGLFFFILAEFMILYCKDSLGCIDNNNIELINNVSYCM